MSIESIQTLSIRELFSADQYIIPVYQRNYAWEAKEINQLIQDITDYAVNKQNANYYIGTLVIYPQEANGETKFETIDGQQRLTTLNILLNVIRREFVQQLTLPLPQKAVNLAFESRPHATETLKAIASETDEIPYQEHRTYAPAISRAYTIAHLGLQKILNENRLNIADFYEYLMNRVFILRVAVPHNTDLNHYFEIMNNRGEQLEKHEILKARLLEKIKHNTRASYAFTKVWEACADMERYVQYGFSVIQRNALFLEGDWNRLQAKDFQELSTMLFQYEADAHHKAGNGLDSHSLSITQILEPGRVFEEQQEENNEAPERFTSVISFPNFLLHVLRIQTKEDVPLDDKRLLDTFEKYLKRNDEDPASFVHTFAFNLLRTRFLFDKYILKREVLKEQEQWSLKRLKLYDKNRVSYVNTFGEDDTKEGYNQNLLMLLAMFHVSAPTQVYKHWLNAALKFLFEQEDVEPVAYQNYLENLARTYLFSRFLKKEPDGYFQIIYEDVTKPQENELDKERLNQGTAVENFIFNYLDYLLWKKRSEGYHKFDFAFRSSVEHYYPQNPLGNIDRLTEGIHEFGNLCLISSSKNAQLSNNLPTAKKDYYYKVGADSLKQQLMMNFPTWGIDEIRHHGRAMKEILFEELTKY